MRRFKVHTIKEGKHRANKPRLRLYWNKKRMAYDVLFTNSCLYETKDPKNQKDINKLFGFSFGLHHKNSVRFGWRDNGVGKIDLMAYIYRNGKRINEWDESIYIETVDVNTPYRMEISVGGGNFMFTVLRDSKIVGATIIKHGKLFPIGYHLNPYFGGDEKAPHDMDIELYRIL